MVEARRGAGKGPHQTLRVGRVRGVRAGAAIGTRVAVNMRDRVFIRAALIIVATTTALCIALPQAAAKNNYTIRKGQIIFAGFFKLILLLEHCVLYTRFIMAHARNRPPLPISALHYVITLI